MVFPNILINCCDEHTNLLSSFFAYSFDSSMLPDVWQKSFINLSSRKAVL
jgi:hypothetical protein